MSTVQVELSTKERLLAAAWGCLCEAGLAATTSRAITESAGANLASITYYFGSKDALVGEAIEAEVERLIAPALAALEDDAADAVTRMLTAVTALQDAYRSVGDDAPVFLEAALQARRLPSTAARLSSFFARLRQLLAARIAQQQAGALPGWADPDAMAALLLAVAQGIVAERATDPEAPSAEAMSAQFAQLLIAASPPGTPENRRKRSRSMQS
jgi:AcrR family transcriptional regulator